MTINNNSSDKDKVALLANSDSLLRGSGRTDVRLDFEQMEDRQVLLSSLDASLTSVDTRPDWGDGVYLTREVSSLIDLYAIANVGWQILVVPFNKKFVDLEEKIGQSKTSEPTHGELVAHETGLSERVTKIIELLNRTPSENFELATKDMQLLLDNVRTEIAARLTPLINDKLRSMPSHDYEDKKDLCKWLTATLRPLFLAVKSGTGAPSILAASGNTGNGVFRFVESSESGPKRFVGSSSGLPTIELLPAPPRAEGLIRKRE